MSMKEKLNIAMFGHKRIPSREGGVEIVVEEPAKKYCAGCGAEVTGKFCSNCGAAQE